MNQWGFHIETSMFPNIYETCPILYRGTNRFLYGTSISSYKTCSTWYLETNGFYMGSPPPYVHTGLLNMGHIVFFNTRTVKMYTDTHLKISEPNLWKKKKIKAHRSTKTWNRVQIAHVLHNRIYNSICKKGSLARQFSNVTYFQTHLINNLVALMMINTV